jgi:hypothetical protein
MEHKDDFQRFMTATSFADDESFSRLHGYSPAASSFFLFIGGRGLTI